MNVFYVMTAALFIFTSALADVAAKVKPGGWATTTIAVPLLAKPGGKGLIALSRGTEVQVKSVIGGKAYLVTVMTPGPAFGMTGVLPGYTVKEAAPPLPVKSAADVADFGSGYWDFKLHAGRIKAVAAQGARYESLPGGAFGTGPAPIGTIVDITGAFPPWVADALARQRDSGIRLSQIDPRLPPEANYHAYSYELGYGNCHGFSFHVTDLYPNLPIETWAEESVKNATTTPPDGSPLQLRQVDSIYQVVDVMTNSRDRAQAPHTLAYYDRLSAPGGKTWATILTVGRDQVREQIRSRGGVAVQEPRFGDLCFARGDVDHSLIALGPVKDHVYGLQKMSPMNPYFVSLVPIAQVECYRLPPQSR